MIKDRKVLLTLKIDEVIAREVAEAVMFRANAHQQSVTADRLATAGIDVTNLTKYFVELGKLVAEFHHNNWEFTAKLSMKPEQIRNLYLPLIYGVVFSSLGNVKVGNYSYLIVAQPGEKVDVNFLVQFSATLEANRDIVRGEIGQIGNRKAEPQTPVMLSILGRVAEDKRDAEMWIRDGVTVDTALAGFSTLVGLSLVEASAQILYTGVESVNFRELVGTIVEKNVS